MTLSINLKGNTVAVNSTPSAVSNAVVVMLTNNTASLALVTQKTGSGVALATVPIVASGSFAVQKDPTDTLESNSSIMGTPIGYTY